MTYNLFAIEDPSFLKQLSFKELNVLSSDIREFLIENIAKTGGHLSSNLGVVELTIALHYSFNSPTDKIFFDVGHQSYVHKILTGRASKFSTLRQFKGLSGFQKRSESIHDVWEAGHSSTALSAAVGMACARDLDHLNYHIVPVIGDAAMVGGESLEALNHLGEKKQKVIIVLNDNQMSIGKNVGGFNEFLSGIRTSHAYLEAKNDYRSFLSKNKIGQIIYRSTSSFKNIIKDRMIDSKIFGEFGIDYIGPIDGHNIPELIRAFEFAKKSSTAVVVHVLTKKGKGYAFAENDIDGRWHGVEPFDVETGKNLNQTKVLGWSEFIASTIHEKMAENGDIVTITPAMISGSKLGKIFKDYPERSFDVGIAEEHATTFAAGLAINHKKPFLSIYSSFLQRAYDQINHDLARMNLPCVIGIDRAGLAYGDGETHHGIYDIGILKGIPNTTIFTPICKEDAKWYLDEAFNHNHGVYCIRYGKEEAKSLPCDLSKYALGKWQYALKNENAKANFITYGQNVNEACLYALENNLNINIINACFAKPIDEEMIIALGKENLPLYVYETDVQANGLGKDIAFILSSNQLAPEIHYYGFSDSYIGHGAKNDLLKQQNMLLSSILNNFKENNE